MDRRKDAQDAEPLLQEATINKDIQSSVAEDCKI